MLLLASTLGLVRSPKFFYTVGSWHQEGMVLGCPVGSWDQWLVTGL